MRFLLALSLAAVLISGRVSHAEVLAYEGFDYPEGPLAGQSGGFGWEGAWGVGGDAVVVAGSLAYNDGATDLPTSGNHVLVGGESGTATAVRNLTSDLTLEAGTYWMSFVGQRQLPHPDTPNNYARAAAVQTQFVGSASVEQFSIGKRTDDAAGGDVSQTWDLFSIAAVGAGLPDSDVSSGVDQAQQVFALAQIEIVGGTDDADDDTVSLWIDPSLDPNAPLGTPNAVNTGIDDYLFDAIRLFAGGTNDSGLYAQVAIDELRIGTTLADALIGQIVPGDTDGNGVVTGADLDPIRANYRQAVEFRSQGDLDGDGVVTFADFREFKTALLASGGSLAGLSIGFLSIPEPASASICFLAAGGLIAIRRRASTVLMALVALTLTANSSLAVTVVGDKYDGVTTPRFGDSPSVLTVDPYENPPVTRARNRGITETRRMRQTFKNSETFNVGEIIISFDVTGGSVAGSAADTGLGLRIYEVEDVLASSWSPVGLPIAEILFTDTLPSSSETLSFELSASEVFELPARSSGTMGYGIEISTPFALSSDGNPGVLFFADNTDATDFYADGRYYLESGNASSAHRDVGVSFLPSTSSPFLPGDTNGDGLVDVDTDLAAIAANFRQQVADRALGDLTGDGLVDFSDFDEWKTNYGGSLANLDLAFLAIPEPTSLALAVLGACFLGPGRRAS